MSLRVALLESIEGGGEAALAVERSCRANRFHVERIEARALAPDATLADVARAEVDVVFPLVASRALAAHIAWVFAWARIPCAGSGPRASARALDRRDARAVLASRGVAIPDGFLLERGDGRSAPPLGDRRWIAHVGATRCAIESETQLRGSSGVDCVEEDLVGREFHVALLGSGAGVEVLPLGEVDRERSDAKSGRDFVEYDARPTIGARPMSRELESSVRATARAAYAALALEGYGRVVLRLDAHGVPRAIDVDPRPDLSPDAGFAKAAARAHIDHAELVRRIVDDALERTGTFT